MWAQFHLPVLCFKLKTELQWKALNLEEPPTSSRCSMYRPVFCEQFLQSKNIESAHRVGGGVNYMHTSLVKYFLKKIGFLSSDLLPDTYPPRCNKLNKSNYICIYMYIYNDSILLTSHAVIALQTLLITFRPSKQ